jgi:hypothetical protein
VSLDFAQNNKNRLDKVEPLSKQNKISSLANAFARDPLPDADGPSIVIILLFFKLISYRRSELYKIRK